MLIGYDRYIVKSKYGCAIMRIIPKDITVGTCLKFDKEFFFNREKAKRRSLHGRTVK